MLSSVAYNVYWLARYLERMQNTARLVLTTTHLMLDIPRSAPLRWSSLIDVLGCQSFLEHPDEATSLSEQAVCKFLISSPDVPASILANAKCARENARVSRDVVSSEVWEYINRLHLFVKNQAPKSTSRVAREEFLREVIEKVQSILGAMHGTFIRGPAYQFLRIGIHLERGDMITRILDGRIEDTLLAAPDEADHTYFYSVAWVGILQSVSGLEIYRRSVQNSVVAEQVIHFLLLNDSFPRSLRCCLGEINMALHDINLPESTGRLMALDHQLQAMLIPAEMTTTYLHNHMDQLQLKLMEFDRALTQTFFIPETTQ